MGSDKIDRLLREKERLGQGGGAKRIVQQHEKGKLTARERLALLFDGDTFREMHLFMKHRCSHFGLENQEFPGEGVVTGHGLVDGRPLYAASQDFTVAGGAVGEATARKICEIQDQALATGNPFVFINDSGGARIQEGVDSLDGYGAIFYRNIQLSGVVPQICIIAGPCAGGAVYSPALTDFVIQVQGIGQMFITGPKVIEQVTGERVTPEDLGGAQSHARYSGVTHFVAQTEAEAFAICRKLLSFLPSSNAGQPPVVPGRRDDAAAANRSLDAIVPDNPREAYDMHQVILGVVDGADFLEVQRDFAPNLVVGFGRLDGHAVGIVGNNPQHKAGVLDIDSSCKGARFIRFCNAFDLPVVTFVDVPGFLPGVQQEYGGIIRHGAKMLFAYGASIVPKVTVVTRKAYGGAYLAMCGKSMGADRVAAWPSAEIAVMGAEGAVNVLYRRDIEEAASPAEMRLEKIREYTETFANPYVAAGRGMVDDIIEPAETRRYLVHALAALRTKRAARPPKKHGLIPL
ncbi:MAG TPA: carboxyl transferase domain-containing protein [Candidatus Krumholzibacteria bacterium]|nr:carboxyl transferase domain-containing protein [Candidatus Krumholzibacteria bacterium]HPD71151.1 carboxyl transferase domain-containing protein [Candidatus Krumholzibacteria bacterium]HRY39149.1 carboxyl transferase domain-containing protein [Candidatus Krumholzibacteria bacterium]